MFDSGVKNFKYNSNPLPEIGYVRLKQILGDLKADPPIPPIIPVGKSSWWAGVKAGIYPKPIKLSKRVTVWRASDIRALVEGIESHTILPSTRLSSRRRAVERGGSLSDLSEIRCMTAEQTEVDAGTIKNMER